MQGEECSVSITISTSYKVELGANTNCGAVQWFPLSAAASDTVKCRARLWEPISILI